MTTSVPLSVMENQKAKVAEKKISHHDQREKSDPLPLDILWEIFKSLPVKTLGRFIFLSKEHASIIRNRDFMKSYLVKASTRPQTLMFTFKNMELGKHIFFSATHPQNQGESSSSIATYHLTCSSLPFTTHSPSVHGLICHGPPWKLRLYNPSTKCSITLPKPDTQRLDLYHYVGYDPIDGDYKVLGIITTATHYIMGYGLAQELWVLTLGNGSSWRVIKNCPQHCLYIPCSPEICIDGVLYYGAMIPVDGETITCSYAVMSFDVRSEEFCLIKVPEGALRPKLTNYEGKLALLFSGHGSRINVWVLEDAEKHEWSKKMYVLPVRGDGDFYSPFCATNTGEFVLACQNYLPDPFHVLYYDPRKNTVKRVNIEGISELVSPRWDHNIISIFSGQVDNLMFL